MLAQPGGTTSGGGRPGAAAGGGLRAGRGAAGGRGGRARCGGRPGARPPQPRGPELWPRARRRHAPHQPCPPWAIRAGCGILILLILPLPLPLPPPPPLLPYPPPYTLHPTPYTLPATPFCLVCSTGCAGARPGRACIMRGWRRHCMPVPGCTSRAGWSKVRGDTKGEGGASGLDRQPACHAHLLHSKVICCRCLVTWWW